MGPASTRQGQSSRRGSSRISALDMYRKVPGDLVEGSRQGSIISWIALFTMAYLFYHETADYLTTRLTSELSLDRRRGGKKSNDDDDMIKVTFNITMMDLSCPYIEVDVVSVLGNNQNVTKAIQKYPLDASGVTSLLATRNMRQHDVADTIALHDAAVTKSIEDLHESGETAIHLDEHTLQYAIRENDLVFVDFFASWCSHCQVLAPTWEVLAKVMNDASDESVEDGEEKYGEQEFKSAEALDVPVIIAKVDCVNHKTLCQQQDIRAYPTLRLFVKGQPYEGGDYHGHRTVIDLVQFLKLSEEQLGREGNLSHESLSSALEKHLDMSVEERHWAEAFERTRKRHHQFAWNPDDHPGCQLSGSILLHRVPGNFYIQAFSPTHDLVPHMTNVSHEIHSLTFTPTQKSSSRSPVPHNFIESMTPMNGNVYVTHNLHEAYHHYIKLISTNGDSFQVLQSSQLASYQQDVTPEAKFIIDLSPIAVRYERSSRHWYDYVTSLMAIIGGTFTVVGMFESGARAVAETRRKISYRRGANKHVY
jgi:thiol-disulfide isomerase/thioredoxin